MDDQQLQAIAEREEEVLGAPPRIEPLTGDDADEGARARSAQLREAITGRPTSAHDVTANQMVLALMRHVDLYDRVEGLSVQLIAHGTLSARDRELVILRISWLCQAPYEFGEHVRLATSLGCVRHDEVDWIRDGSSAAGWDDHDRAVVRAAEELHGEAMITDGTWEQLVQTYDDQQLIELPVLAGQATMVAYLQNACRFPLVPANEGLRSR